MGKQTAIAIPKKYFKKVFRFCVSVSELIVRGFLRQCERTTDTTKNYLKQLFRF